MPMKRRSDPVTGPQTHEAGSDGLVMSAIPIERKIGAVIRRQRLANDLTLSDVAMGAGLSRAMLSRVETGRATASLEKLERICIALGISMSDVFRDIEGKRGFAQHIKRNEQMEVVRTGTRHGHTYRLLSYTRGPKKTFEPFLIEMDKDSEVSPRFQHPGTEFIYMLSGRMEYRFGDRTYLLEPGDTLTFSGEVEHGPEVLLDEKAQFLTVMVYGE
jgi:transcriptional regulator with XRE-family HTH domain